MPTVQAGTATVHYLVDGAGPGLVLVHGTGFGAEGTWGQMVEHFTDARTVIRPNFAGSDETVDDGGPLTIEALADQVTAAARVADGPIDLVGFSLGAVVAATVAAREPNLVRRLILASGWPSPEDVYLHNMMTTWLSIADNPEAFGRFGTLMGFSRNFLNLIGSSEVDNIVASNLPTEGALRQIALNLTVDIRALLPKIKAPTLVIGCTRDQTVPVENARALHEAIEGSTYAEIDSGHVVLFEQPGEFVKLVKDFIN